MLSHSEEETRKIAKEVGKKLQNGDIVALFGELGAGKTVFVKGICKVFGITRRVKSPSFTVIREYIPNKTHNSDRLPNKIYHIDLYRIKDPSSILIQEVYERLGERNGICLIEWADRIEDLLPEDVVKIHIKIIDEKTRKISIKSFPYSFLHTPKLNKTV